MDIYFRNSFKDIIVFDHKPRQIERCSSLRQEDAVERLWDALAVRKRAEEKVDHKRGQESKGFMRFKICLLGSVRNTTAELSSLFQPNKTINNQRKKTSADKKQLGNSPSS